ncbi:MAG TPA: Rieske (2Fe-2S) protein [Chloroflexota bacterium]|jgi:nitrite reductase/ring-hydroxylating ferredoxin subunit
MAEVVVARVDEFAEGSRRIVRHGRLEVGVFRQGGRYYALPNVCAHQFGPLCEGTITGTLAATEDTAWRRTWVQEGEILVCPWHALEFDLTTGRCIAYPKVKLRQFPVRVEGDHVVVTV